MAKAGSSTSLARDVGDGWARLVRGAIHGECLLLPGGSLGVGGEAFGEMNWADVHGPDGAVAAEAFRAFADRLRARRLPGIITATSAVAEEVAVAARDLALEPDEHAMPLMACAADRARPVAGRYETQLVTDDADSAQVAQVLGEAFECPPWMCVNMLGRDLASTPDLTFFASLAGGEIVSVAGTVRVGTTVGVYAVGTRPRSQGRGAASAALSAAMRHHQKGGAETFGLHASDAGRPVYERLGFEVVDRVSAWIVEAR
jgi:ribosomal protein S18 acetylase RimI-like enzyme